MGGSGKDVVVLRRSGKGFRRASHICRTLFVQQHDRISTLLLGGRALSEPTPNPGQEGNRV